MNDIRPGVVIFSEAGERIVSVSAASAGASDGCGPVSWASIGGRETERSTQ
jgi:hypothetical protein